MKDVTKVKGLGNLPTATSKRLRARPPQRGTAHLDMYLISTEKRRLEGELAHLDDRRRRVQEHLKGSQKEMTRLRQVAQEEEADQRSDYDGGKTMDVPPTPKAGQRPWRTMPFEY